MNPVLLTAESPMGCNDDQCFARNVGHRLVYSLDCARGFGTQSLISCTVFVFDALAGISVHCLCRCTLTHDLC